MVQTQTILFTLFRWTIWFIRTILFGTPQLPPPPHLFGFFLEQPIAFSLILFSFLQFKPDKRTVCHDIVSKLSINISLLSRLNGKKKTAENVNLIGTWFYSVLCLVSSLQSPVFTLYAISWLKSRRNERREMCL